MDCLSQTQVPVSGMNRPKPVKLRDVHADDKSSKARAGSNSFDLKRALLALVTLFAVSWMSYTVGTWNSNAVVQAPHTVTQPGQQ